MPHTARLKYIKVQPGPGGAEYHYFRHQGIYQRLPGAPGSAEYLHRYADLLATIEVKQSRTPEGSVRAVVNDFKASAEFSALVPKTRRDYDRMLALLDPIGSDPLVDVKRKHILLIWDHLKEKPRTAKLFAQVVSRLFTWAIDRGLVDINPAEKIKRLGRVEHRRAWTDAECAAFEAACPPGPLFAAYMLGLFTGQREGDVLRMTRAAYDGATIAVRQSKTDTSLRIPAHRDLKAYLDNLPVGSVFLVAGAGGRPVLVDTFRHQFKEASRRGWLAGDQIPRAPCDRSQTSHGGGLHASPDRGHHGPQVIIDGGAVHTGRSAGYSRQTSNREARRAKKR